MLRFSKYGPDSGIHYSHWFLFVNSFFSVCHNKRPPMILIFYHRRPLDCIIYRIFFTGSSVVMRFLIAVQTQKNQN